MNEDDVEVAGDDAYDDVVDVTGDGLQNTRDGLPARRIQKDIMRASLRESSFERDAVAAAMIGQRTVRQRTDCSSSAAANETAASASIDQQQATEAAQAAAAVKSAEEKKRYDRAIEKIEHYVASGLDLDVDSDDEGGEDEEDGASAKRKRRCYKPKSNSAIRSYLEDILVKVKNRHVSIDYGTCWVPPRNPLRRSLGKTAAPDEFYVSKAWVRGTGPFGIGVESAHYKHVLISYNYGVNAGVRRKGQPDFGHWRLDIEDLIQNKMRQIWNVTAFPHRDNMSEFNPIDDFVAALSHNARFVTKSDNPHRRLTGGLRFMAIRMRVYIPPLPIQGKEEHRMLREKLKVTPTPNKQQLESWCEQFKERADGVNIFPKLPHLLRTGVQQYQVSQKIRILGLHTEEGFNKLLGELRTDVVLENPEQQRRSTHTEA
ncbi:hypothetical protein THAOC_35219 [Thalassiosira oceanica]|uniref:Uncharacterized protein n=1 Tax=Thalassiosira oceanica TaxID=159749 RepID=K0RAQ6_THAOC|nr:hypothetical protein THAOC_35219 [Thalassiosira oceanica]|eukprot:EJK46131.1 hypothetical protein THAOC_35219 [Thalassiosira oceanica]